MKNTFEKYPFFLLFLPLFIVLHVQKIYGHLINYQFVAKEILVIFIAPIIIYFISLAFLKSVSKANLLSFISILLFYFAGDIKDGLKAKWPGSLIQSYSFLLPAIFIIIVISFFIIKRKKISKKITLFSNMVVLLVIIIDGLGLLIPGPDNSSTLKKEDYKQACSNCQKPDIYYIIFDSYSSSSLLAKEFNYDNSVIDNFLKGNGFRIIKDSRSNYNLTPFSIGSIFRMQYLENPDTSHVLHLKDYLAAVDKLYYADLIPALENQGYNIYNHSIFDFKDHKSSVPPFDIWKIKSIYQQFNIIKKMYNEIGWNFPSWMNIRFGKSESYPDSRDKHDSIALRHLYKTITDTSSAPKFVYTHFFLPHSPYSFDSSGHKIPILYELSPQEDKNAYIGQLVHVNKIMKEIVETIKLQSKRNTVIIIQGDHGYRFFDPTKKSQEFPNLNAIYFPNNDYHLVDDSMSSVNTFRLVFNTFFKQGYSMLPTESYFLKYK